MTRAAEVFVGRSGELGVLAERLDRARAGRSQVVVVDGPPGVGKTALVREALRLDRDRAAQRPSVLWAGGEEAEELVAYGILDQLARSADVHPRDGSPEGLPGIDARAATEPAAAGASLLTALDAVRRPCVLVVDDVQWADLPSVQALVFALRRLGRAAVLTVAVTRDQTGHTQVARLTRLADGPDGHHLHLRGLTTGELTELGERLGHDRMPCRAVERLHAHTGGSPLHARALFDEVEPGRLRDPGRPLPCPETFALLVAERLHQCTPATRELVRAAAVLGERCPLGTAHRLASGDGQPPDPAAVDEAVTAGLLTVERTGPDTVLAFGHGLRRVAVLQDMELAERVRLHTRAAGLPGGVDQVLAHRVAACLDRDPELARDLDRRADELEAGDERARAGSHRVHAARLYTDAGDRERALSRAVETFVTAGETARAEALADAVAALPSDARRDHTLAWVEFARGRPAQAEERLRRAWERAGDGTDTDLRARIAARLCHVCYLQLRHDEALRWGERARELGLPYATPLVTSLALAGRAPDPGTAAPPEGGAGAVLARGSARLWREELAGAHADLTRAVRLLRESGRFQIRLHATGYLVLTELRMGRWDDAAQHASEVVSLARDAEQDWVLARLHSYAAMANAVRGEASAAAGHVAAARSAATATGLGLDRVGVTIAAAQVASVEGAHAEVVRLLDALATPSRLGHLADPGVSQWPCVLAGSLVALDRLGEAQDVLEPFERRSVELDRRLARSAAARVRARIEATRDREAAARTLRSAVALADDAGGAVEAALARLEYGKLLRRSGSRREAADALGAAAAALHRMGSGPAAQRCASELDACGLTPVRRSANDRRRLTPRERAVAGLAADGLSNPQVAAELVVSLNTVEYHLRNVFTKLGITSRVEIGDHLD